MSEPEPERQVHVLTKHGLHGRMDIEGVYEDMGDANSVAAISTVRRVQTFPLIPSSSRSHEAASLSEAASGTDSTQVTSI